MSRFQEHVAQVGRDPLVTYHHPCPDGACAAWLARRRWPGAELVGVAAGTPVEVRDGALRVRVENKEVREFPLAGRDLFLLDWAPRNAREALPLLATAARSVLLLDHHETTLRELGGPEVDGLWDLGMTYGPRALIVVAGSKEASGAGLALEAFGLPHGHYMRAVVEAVQARDVWSFALTSTKPIGAYLELAGVARDPRRFDDLPAFDRMVEEGDAMLRYQEALVARVADRAEVCRWAEGEVLVVCCPVLQSEVGEALYSKAPGPLKVGVIWSEDAEGTRVSLRSADDGADCAVMAKSRGGGGHARSAGFKVPHRGPWRWSARLDRNVHQDDASAVAAP